MMTASPGIFDQGAPGMQPPQPPPMPQGPEGPMPEDPNGLDVDPQALAAMPQTGGAGPMGPIPPTGESSF